MDGPSDDQIPERELASARIAGWRERLRVSLWFVPGLMVAVVIALEQAAITIDRREGGGGIPLVTFVDDTDSATAVLPTISSSTLTFMGVVFSITIVALQLASSQFSPRVLRTFLSDRMTQVALGSFVATFVYALLVLRQVDPSADGEPFVPGLAVFVAVVLVLFTVAVFIAFVHHIVHSIRVVEIIESVADETREAIEANLPAEDADPGLQVDGDDDALGLGPVTGMVKIGGAARVLAGIEVDRLVELARAHDATFVLTARVGDFLPGGVPVLRVHGGSTPDREDLERCLDLTDERTMYQDVRFGLRQLVDIAVKALSPGINDPTTAGQAVDRIVDLLRRIGRRPVSPNAYHDADGTLRLLRPQPSWDDIVHLGLTEIRLYGAGSIQVARRLSAAYEDLEATVADRFPERVRVLHEERDRLVEGVARSFEDPADQALALRPDRIGLG